MGQPATVFVVDPDASVRYFASMAHFEDQLRSLQ